MTDLRKAAEQALFRLLGDENHGIQLRAAVALLQAPVREWVGLTDAEVEGYWDWKDFQCGCGRGTLLEMVRDIEAKLKEKNHA